MVKKKTETKAAAKGEDSASARAEKAILAVASVLKAAGWEAQRTDAPGSVAFDVEVGGREAIRLAHASLFTTGERLALLFIFRKKAAKARRADVAELITRINYGLITGGLEMDMDGGEVRYRYGLDYSGVELDPLLVRNAVLSSLDVLQRYEAAIHDVMAAAASPKQALAKAEAAAAAHEATEGSV